MLRLDPAGKSPKYQAWPDTFKDGPQRNGLEEEDTLQNLPTVKKKNRGTDQDWLEFIAVWENAINSFEPGPVHLQWTSLRIPPVKTLKKQV